MSNLDENVYSTIVNYFCVAYGAKNSNNKEKTLEELNSALQKLIVSIKSDKEVNKISESIEDQESERKQHGGKTKPLLEESENDYLQINDPKDNNPSCFSLHSNEDVYFDGAEYVDDDDDTMILSEKNIHRGDNADISTSDFIRIPNKVSNGKSSLRQASFEIYSCGVLGRHRKKGEYPPYLDPAEFQLVEKVKPTYSTDFLKHKEEQQKKESSLLLNISSSRSVTKPKKKQRSADKHYNDIPSDGFYSVPPDTVVVNKEYDFQTFDKNHKSSYYSNNAQITSSSKDSLTGYDNNEEYHHHNRRIDASKYYHHCSINHYHFHFPSSNNISKHDLSLLNKSKFQNTNLLIFAQKYKQALANAHAVSKSKYHLPSLDPAIFRSQPSVLCKKDFKTKKFY